jgi:hypothetical protein
VNRENQKNVAKNERGTPSDHTGNAENVAETPRELAIRKKWPRTLQILQNVRSHLAALPPNMLHRAPCAGASFP